MKALAHRRLDVGYFGDQSRPAENAVGDAITFRSVQALQVETLSVSSRQGRQLLQTA